VKEEQVTRFSNIERFPGKRGGECVKFLGGLKEKKKLEFFDKSSRGPCGKNQLRPQGKKKGEKEIQAPMC